MATDDGQFEIRQRLIIASFEQLAIDAQKLVDTNQDKQRQTVAIYAKLVNLIIADAMQGDWEIVKGTVDILYQNFFKVNAHAKGTWYYTDWPEWVEQWAAFEKLFSQYYFLESDMRAATGHGWFDLRTEYTIGTAIDVLFVLYPYDAPALHVRTVRMVHTFGERLGLSADEVAKLPWVDHKAVALQPRLSWQAGGDEPTDKQPYTAKQRDETEKLIKAKQDQVKLLEALLATIDKPK